LGNNKLPGVDTIIPSGNLAFLATGLSAGVQYRLDELTCEHKFVSLKIM